MPFKMDSRVLWESMYTRSLNSVIRKIRADNMPLSMDGPIFDNIESAHRNRLQPLPLYDENKDME